MSSDDFYDLYASEFPDISRERVHLISAIANDTWVDDHQGSGRKYKKLARQWREKEIEFVTTCANPRELFLFVDLYNWDKGQDLLKAIAVNPACDWSTALAIFWAASPTHFQKYPSREHAKEYERDDWDFVIALLNRLNAGVYQPPATSFDPFDWDAKDANAPGSYWMIPPYLCQPVVV